MNQSIKDKLKLRRELVDTKTKKAIQKEIESEIVKAEFKNELMMFYRKSGTKLSHLNDELKRLIPYTRELTEAVIDCAIAKYLDDIKSYQYYKGIIMGECRIIGSHGGKRPTGQSVAVAISLSMLLFKQVNKLVSTIIKNKNKGTIWDRLDEEKYKS